MKLTFILALLLGVNSWSQNIRIPNQFLYYDPVFLMDNGINFDYNFSNRTNVDIIKTNAVKSYSVIKESSKGKKKVVTEREFNDKGLLVKETNKNYERQLIYENEKLMSVIKTVKNDVFRNDATYDKEGRIVSIKKYANGKCIREYRYEYFEGNKRSLIEEIGYGRKIGIKRYVTNYDPLLKSPIESMYYRNGKLKAKWTYSCDTKGEIVDTKVEEVNSCSYDAKNNDGSYIQYNRTIREGKIYLTESIFSKDSVLLEQKSFVDETKLVYHMQLDGNTTMSEGFRENGKRFYKTISKKDENGNVISYRYASRSGKEKYGYDCVFNSKLLAESVKYVDEDAKLIFEYTYY